MSEALAPHADRTTVEFPVADGYRSVGRLVLGGVAARFELPIDRVDDLLLAVESLLSRPGRDSGPARGGSDLLRPASYGWAPSHPGSWPTPGSDAC